MTIHIMEELCCICQDEMTVSGYDNENLGEIIIDKDCTRLKCGHALHSKCMIEGLQAYSGKCLVCSVSGNSLDYELCDNRLLFESRCLKLLGELRKKDPEVKEAALDFKAFRGEYSKKVFEFKKKMKESYYALEKEMEMKRYKQDYKDSANVLIKTFRKLSNTNNIYQIALSKITRWKLEHWICGPTLYYPGSYRYARYNRLL